MTIKIFSTLSAQWQEAVNQLIVRCREYEPLNLSFPMEDAGLFALALDDDGRLLAAAAFTEAGDGGFECAAFTSPDCRCQGIFSSLLETGIENLPEDTDLYFYTDGNSSGAMETIKALEMEFLFSEHMMECNLLGSGELPRSFELTGSVELPTAAEQDPSRKSDVPEALSNPAAPLLSCSQEVREDQTPLMIFRGFHGTATVAVQEAFYYLYGVEIEEEFRGQGFGMKLLSAILQALPCQRTQEPQTSRPSRVRLQVSGDNLGALSLYKKTGFRITETLSCYLY